LEKAKKIGRAGGLLLFRRIWSLITNLVVMGVLARYIPKSDFGVVAICTVVVSLFSVLVSFGIGEFVVTHKTENQESSDNQAFTLNILLGFFLFIVLLFFFYGFADYFKEQKIREIGIIMSFTFFAESMVIVPKAILRRELKYDVIVFYLSVFGTLISLLKLVLVFSNFGVHSLIIPPAILSFLLALTIIAKTKLKVQSKLDLSIMRDLFKISFPTLGSNVLTFFVNEGDSIIVGKFLGLDSLGLYSLAFNVSNIFQNNFLPIITDISLPAFSMFSGNIVKLRMNYFRMVRILSLFSVLILSLMITHAEFIIITLYGLAWKSAIVPLQILLVFTIFRSISSPTSGLFYATGNAHKAFLISLVFTPVFLSSVYFGSFYGVIGVCIGVTISRVLGAISTLNLSLKLVNSDMLELAKLLYPVFIISFFHICIGTIILYFMGNNTFFTVVALLTQLVVILLMLYFNFNSYMSNILDDFSSLYPRLEAISVKFRRSSLKR
jgi:O-antigen/teichoic acid export membrane protein